VDLARSITTFVESAGKEAPPRRARLRQIITFAADTYRALARARCGASLDIDAEMQGAIAGAGNWPGDAELAAACASRCLEALAQVDRNANQNTLIECWVDDLSQLAAGTAAW
jgi:DNA polymerase-3 subunit delta'